MANSSQPLWDHAFATLIDNERLLFALAAGFPVQGRGVRIDFEPPELRGKPTLVGATLCRSVVMPLRLKREGAMSPEALTVRVGHWPTPDPKTSSNQLVVAGRLVLCPPRPDTLVQGLEQHLLVGSLAELLRVNLQRQPHGFPPDAGLLSTGAGQLLRTATAELERRLLLGAPP